jgi:23S rRNA (guanosine2251-2'-O)-methyltransferase
MTTRVVAGLQPVREAVAAHGPRLERVLVEARRDAPKLDALARFAQDRGAKVERVSRSELDKTARGAYHQGAVAIAPALALLTLEELVSGAAGPVIALDEVEDPQNFGAIVRSCVALGARGILFPESHAAPLTTATFRASAGAIEHARLCRVASLPRALEELETRGLVPIGLDASGDDLASANVGDQVVLVVGAEGKGLRRGVRAACRRLVRIPMAGPLASLNASVAAGVALYELSRQRASATT